MSNRSVLFDIKSTKKPSKQYQCDDFAELCRKSAPKQNEMLGKTNNMFVFKIDKATKLNNKLFYFIIITFSS